MRRALAALVLAGVMVGVAWTISPAAQASPAQSGEEGNGNCIELLRFTYTMPERITPPDKPENHGRENPTVIPPDYMVTYCRDGEGWKKTRDPFPYDDPDLCVKIFYDPDNHGGQNPPDQVAPLDEIDNYGNLDGTEGFYGTEFLEEYCRQGTTWHRGAREDDYPEGDYHEWSDECLTVLSTGNKPRHTTQHPETLGEVIDGDDSDPNLGYIDSSQLVTYCKKKGTDDWYRVDDVPLSEILPDNQEYRAQKPNNGTCVVIYAPFSEGELPEVLPEAGHPTDYGTYMPRSDYESANGRNSYDLKQLMCFVNGRWRRGDKLLEGCAGEMVLPQGGFLPSECWGRFPTENYDIGYDAGAWNHVTRKLYGWWTDFFFSVGKGATQVSLWSIGWAYDFDISKYDQFGLNLGESYRTNLTENPAFNIFGLFWMILIGYAAINILRGKTSMALGEIAVSFLLLVLSAVLLANRADYMRSTWDVMDKATTDLLVAGRGENPAESDASIDEVIKETQRQLHKVFVEQPYDYINWGKELKGSCAEARNEILARGPHGDDDWPREVMGDADGCDNEKDFNNDPSGTRMLASLLSMGASLVVGFALVAVGLTVVVSKFIALLLFALAPFAVVTVTLPGGGRRMFWLWVTALAQVVAIVVGMAFLLSLLLLALTELFEATENVSMVERFFIILLLVLLLAGARRRFLASGQATAGRWADNLTNIRLGGGGAPWQGPSGSRGVGLLGIDRGMRGALVASAWGAGGTLAAGGRVYAQRMRERRAWHNIVKARRAGDRMAGVQTRSVFRGAMGGAGGLAVATRGATAPVRPASGGGRPPGSAGSGLIAPGGPGVGGPAAAAGRGAARPPAGAPGGQPLVVANRHGQVVGQHTPGQAAGPAASPFQYSSPGPSPRERAAEAQRAGRVHDAAFWRGIDRADERFVRSSERGAVPQSLIQDRYQQHVRRLQNRYQRGTGRPAPMHPEPWAVRPGPHPTTTEIELTEYHTGWSHPMHALRDRLANRRNRIEARRLARRRGF